MTVTTFDAQVPTFDSSRRDQLPEEAQALQRVREAGQVLTDEIGALPQNRATDLAVQRAEESVFWAVKSVTA